jgi:hypothetical protein
VNPSAPQSQKKRKKERETNKKPAIRDFELIDFAIVFSL